MATLTNKKRLYVFSDTTHIQVDNCKAKNSFTGITKTTFVVQKDTQFLTTGARYLERNLTGTKNK